MGTNGEDGDDDLAETVQAVLVDQPVRLGLLFGSQANGTAEPHSDVDVAVEFNDTVDDRRHARLALGVALTRALGTDDVDVVDLDSVRPEVGRSALDGGRILVGETARAEELAREFTRAASQPTPAERRERFDDVLARLDELV